MAEKAVTGFVESKLTVEQLRSMEGLSRNDMVIVCIKQNLKFGGRTTYTHTLQENIMFEFIQQLVCILVAVTNTYIYLLG